ncbi:MAG TPA: alpha/beta fold hydrolase [Gemmatimonadaceae bacterium]|jgi:pimeloyl-ACP methyl ester carboxylesterase
MECDSDSIHVAIAPGALEGSFLCPHTPAPWPAVLLIAGSGPTDRNGNSVGLPGPNNSLQLLAEALAERGIASVRYDKRGIGGSRATLTSEADLRFDMLADDAAAWIQRMRLDPRLSTVTVVGHSEGSLLGLLATQRANADAFVSLEGAGRPASAVIHEQLASRAPAPLAAQADGIMMEIDAGRTVDSVPPALMALFRPSVQPYLISWFRYDPAKEVAALQVPVLVVQGTTDIQVSEADARLLASADPRAKLVIVDGMNHVLKLVPSDMAQQVKSYSDPSLPVAPQLVSAIASFVKGVRPR